MKIQLPWIRKPLHLLNLHILEPRAIDYLGNEVQKDMGFKGDNLEVISFFSQLSRICHHGKFKGTNTFDRFENEHDYIFKRRAVNSYEIWGIMPLPQLEYL